MSSGVSDLIGNGMKKNRVRKECKMFLLDPSGEIDLALSA